MPMMNAWRPAYRALGEHARQAGARVTVTGEGGDEWLTVGPEYMVDLLRSGDLKLTQKMRLEADTPLYAEIHDTWSRKLEAAVHSLPRFPWEPQRDPEQVAGPLPAMPPRRVPSRQDPGDAQGQQ